MLFTSIRISNWVKEYTDIKNLIRVIQKGLDILSKFFLWGSWLGPRARRVFSLVRVLMPVNSRTGLGRPRRGSPFNQLVIKGISF